MATTPDVLVPTLQEFIALVRKKGLARQERFFVQFYGLNQDLKLLCDEATLPGKNIAVRTLRINGMDEYRAATVDYGGNSITLSFIIDTDWTARQAMEEWVATCVNNRMEGNEVGFYTDYVKQIELYTLVPQDEREAPEKIAFYINLIDCFPTSINAMPLSYGANGVHKMSVTFSYKYWTSSFETVDAVIAMEKRTQGGITDSARVLSSRAPGPGVMSLPPIALPSAAFIRPPKQKFGGFGGGGGFSGGGSGSSF